MHTGVASSGEAFTMPHEETRDELAKIKQERDELKSECERLDSLYRRECAAYQKLANSKLGRLTLAYWRVKDRVKDAFRRTFASRRGVDDFRRRMLDKARGMPESNGSRYYAKISVRVGVICDRFMYDALSAAADFVYLPPDVSSETLAGLDCLLVVSTWTGLNGEWRGVQVSDSPARTRALEIIDCCKSRGIPTLFYSKEDPPHYAEYLDFARRCDVVFTSAAECAADYMRDCGHERVHVLRFCANPMRHNPVGMRYARDKGVIFAGSWRSWYAERCRDMETIFDAIVAFGRRLDIVDRDYARSADPKFRYPAKYSAFRHPAIDYAELLKIHKLYDWAVNINTIKNSETMFAARVYELQAMGNLLISNDSVGMRSIFPDVTVANTGEDVRKALDGMSGEALYERQVAGVRRVLDGETCFDRVRELLSFSGVPYNAVADDRQVLVVADEITPEVQSMFTEQSWRSKRLLSVREFTEDEYARADVVAFFSSKARYGRFYIEDMVNGFKYTACDYITKDAYVRRGRVVAGREHDYVDVVRDRSRTVFWRSAFAYRDIAALKGGTKIPNGYSIDHFNYEDFGCGSGLSGMWSRAKRRLSRQYNNSAKE